MTASMTDPGASPGSEVPVALPTTGRHRGSPRRALKVATVTTGLLALFWATLVYGGLAERQSVMSRAAEGGARSAHILDAYAELLIDRVDRALVRGQDVAEAQIAAHGPGRLKDATTRPTWLPALVTETPAHVSSASLLALLDAEGNVIGTAPAADRLRLRAAIEESGLATQLVADRTPPRLIGRAVGLLDRGPLTLLVARRLQAPDGTFAGAVLAGLPVRELDRLYLAADLGKRGAVELRGDGDALFYRFAPSEHAGEGVPSIGSLTGPASGYIRVSAHEADAPLRTVLEISTADVLAQSGAMDVRLFAIGSGVSIAAALMAWLVCRSLSRRDAEMRRRSQFERELLDAIDSTRDIYVEFDGEMRTSEVSCRFERMTEITPGDLIGLGIQAIRGEPADSDGARAFRHAVDNRLPFRNVVAPISLPGGRHSWIRASGKPILDESGTFQGYRCMIADVTDQELRMSAEIHQDRMSALGQLAGGIAHDFNNLLAAILGFAKLLEEDLKSDPPKRKLIERVITSADRAKDLVQHIQSFARVGPEAAEDIDVGAVADDVLPLLRSSFPASTRSETRNDAAGQLVRIDRTKLTQVMVNLCTNANDALEGRDGAIRIALAPASAADRAYRSLTASSTTAPDRFAVQPGKGDLDRILVGQIDPSISYLHLSVADDGAGIGRDHLKRIFEPYFTTKAASKSGGLGLSVVHGIVLAAEGAMSVTTAPDKGTTVDVFLPIAAGVSPTHVETDSAESEATGTVMVVDDEREVREMIAMSLERRGMTVLEYSNGAEALEAFKTVPLSWDAVLTDHGMPGMRGLDLIREIKILRPDLPCVLCTGYSETVTVESALASGADAVLHKPMTLDVLQATVSKLIAASRGEPQTLPS